MRIIKIIKHGLKSKPGMNWLLRSSYTNRHLTIKSMWPKGAKKTKRRLSEPCWPRIIRPCWKHTLLWLTKGSHIQHTVRTKNQPPSKSPIQLATRFTSSSWSRTSSSPRKARNTTRLERTPFPCSRLLVLEKAPSMSLLSVPQRILVCRNSL